MAKVPEMVSLLDFADPDIPKSKADKPFKKTKTELARRLEMKPGEVKVWSDDQRPDYKKKTVRKEECPFCAHVFRKLEAICPRCHNCQACGSYTGSQNDLICNLCGNFNSQTPPEPITIIVGG